MHLRVLPPFEQTLSAPSAFSVTTFLLLFSVPVACALSLDLSGSLFFLSFPVLGASPEQAEP
jgi:hypothetical protein